MPVEAILWGVRNGAVAVSCAFCTERIGQQLNPGLALLPLFSHPVGVWDLQETVAHRVEDGRGGAVGGARLRLAADGSVAGGGDPHHRWNSQRRRSDKRWWVDGHWRQQSWAANHVLHKPIWIHPTSRATPTRKCPSG
jgi:hypothetical protein